MLVVNEKETKKLSTLVVLNVSMLDDLKDYPVVD